MAPVEQTSFLFIYFKFLLQITEKFQCDIVLVLLVEKISMLDKHGCPNFSLTSYTTQLRFPFVSFF